MNHTVFSGIIQMRTYDLIFVVAKKFIIKSRADLIRDSPKMRNLSSSVAFFVFDLLLFVFFSFFQDEKRNFVSLSCNQTMPLAIECVAISTLIIKLVRNMLFSSCFRAIAHLVLHWCNIIN